MVDKSYFILIDDNDEVKILDMSSNREIFNILKTGTPHSNGTDNFPY